MTIVTTQIAVRLSDEDAPTRDLGPQRRREISTRLAALARDRLLAAPVAATPDVRRLAWQVADDAGWAKTYDAEYVASAAELDCPLVTLDARLRRAARRFVEALAPADLSPT